MKAINLIYTLFVGMTTCLIFSSCGSEIQKYNLTLISNGQLFNDSLEINTSTLQNCIPKTIIDNRVFICDNVKFTRGDLNNQSANLIIDHTMANNIKIKMGIELSEEDKLNDISELSNIHFPGLFSLPNSNHNIEFPSNCSAIIQNIDSLENAIRNAILAADEDPIDITIGIDFRSLKTNNNEITIIAPENPNTQTSANQQDEIVVTKSANQNNTNYPNLKLNLEISEDQTELKWYNNSKNGITVGYNISIYKNNQKILTKSNITNNRISCTELNINKNLNVDCEYLLQITAIRTDDNKEFSETYDIELVSPSKFNPRCHLNLQNE
jgi:hypothetical protein